MKPAAKRGGWPSWSLSILLHLLVVAVVAGIWFWRSAPPPPSEQRLAIEASVVTRLPAASEALPAPAADPEPVAEPVPEPVAEPAPEPAVDQAAVAAEKALREEQAARTAEAEHVAEQRRLAEARQAAERKAEQAAKEKIEREKKEREKAEREKVAREKVDLERKQREQAQAELARTQRESELNAKLAEEERVAAVRASGQMQQYLNQIKTKIERAWKRPPSAAPGVQCEVSVTQVPTGVVSRVQVTRCNGDETVRQSVENAVYGASPLPLPADPALFERSFTITFRPD